MGLDAYLRAAKLAGCPRDQLANFRKAGYVGQPKQLLFHGACRECDEEGGPTEVGFGGARGPGKSHGLLAQIALDDCQRVSGLKCLLLRQIGKAVRESFEDLRFSVLRWVKHDYNRSSGTITFPNGSRIILGHFKNESDIDRYLGLEYDIVGVEEATTLSWAKYEAIRTCNRTSKQGFRPRIYSNANPGGIGHAWYKQRFVTPYHESRQTDTRFFLATIDDNKFINDEYRKILDDLTGWRLRAWRHGDWDIAAGQFFTTFRRGVHVIDPIPVESWWELWLTMDYGFTHWNVTLLLGRWQDTIWVIDECARRQELPATNAIAVREMLGRNGIAEERIKQFIAGQDTFAKQGTSGRSIADSWADDGFTLEPANMDRVQGAAEILRKLGDVDRDIRPSIFIFRNCIKLVECLPMLEHDPHRPEDVLKIDTDDRGVGGDDAYDSFRYGLLAIADTARKTVYGYGGGEYSQTV